MTEIPDAGLQTQVDQQLLEQGAFTPLELLLTSGRLVYSDYERWRRGEAEFLDELLLGSPKRIRKQVNAAVVYARKMGLVEEPQTFGTWGTTGANQSLQLSADQDLHHLLSLRFVTRQNVPQLDMFFDNPVVVLVNTIAEALLRGSLAEAEQALDQLYQQAPNHGDLAAFDQLVEALRRRTAPVTDAARELALLQQLVPDAKRLLSAQCRDFLVPQWRRLAKALEGITFDAGQPELHNSYVLGQAQDWVGVSESILSESRWWTQSALCLRLAECGYLRQDRGEVLMAWCYLCWEHSEVAEKTLEGRRWADLNIVNLWHRYLDLEDELVLDDPLAPDLFPAWLILAEPGLVHTLPVDLPRENSEAGQVYATAHRLTSARLEGDSDAEMAQRQALQQYQPVLVGYLKTRL